MGLDINIHIDLSCNAYNQLVRNRPNIGQVSLKDNGRPLIAIDMDSYIANKIESFFEIKNKNGYLQWLVTKPYEVQRITSSCNFCTTVKTNNINPFNALSAEFYCPTTSKVAEFAKTIPPLYEKKEEYRPKDPVIVPSCVILEIDYINNGWDLSMRLLIDEVSRKTLHQ